MSPPAAAAAAANNVLSPSLSATTHISVPVAMPVEHLASNNSKRHALGASSQALLQAARGAIVAGTSGGKAAAAWGEEHPSDADAASSSSSALASAAMTLPPGSPPHGRVPLFPNRRGSRPQPNRAAAAAHDDSPDEEAEDERVSRHQSAPLRPAPKHYVPIAALANQPHSLSLGNLDCEDDALALRASLAERYQRDSLHASGSSAHERSFVDDDTDDSEFDEDAIEAIAPDQDLDI